MNTDVISNGAMNYENAQQRFKISKLEMKIEDDFLFVRISSPLLTGTNHSISLKKNKLRLIITDLPKAGQPISLPLECDLFLPKPGYKVISNEEARPGIITMTLAKNYKLNTSSFLSNQHIA